MMTVLQTKDLKAILTEVIEFGKIVERLFW